MVKLFIGLLGILIFTEQINANECDIELAKLDDDYVICDDYRNQYEPLLSFIVGVYPYSDTEVRLGCVGSPVDVNLPGIGINFYGTILKRECFTDDPILQPINREPVRSCGSIIEVSNQVIGETIPLTGTSFNLVYYSNKVSGRIADYSARIPITPQNSIRNQSYRYDYYIMNLLSGNVINGSKEADPGEEHSYIWDGLDVNANETWGQTRLNSVITFRRGGKNPRFKNSMFFLGNMKAKNLGTGAWLPSIWHFYDPVSNVLFKGDGTSKSVKGITEGAFTRVADEKGKEVYYFDSMGKISHTKNALTGTTIFSFSYDSSNRLTSIMEPFNRVTTFSRYASGALKAIIAPNGAKASITINANGYMSKLVNPNNEVYLMTYDGAGGLLKTFMPPNGDITTLVYDNLGNLISDSHSNGFSALLEKDASGIKRTSAEGRVTLSNYFQNGGREVTKTPSNLEYYITNGDNVKQISSPTGEEMYAYQADSRFNGQVKNLQWSKIDNFGSRLTNFTKDVSLFSSTDIYSINKITDIESIGSSEITSVYDGPTRTKTTSTKLGRTSKVQFDEYERPILSQQGDLVAEDFYYTNNLLSKITQGTRKFVFSYYSNDLLKSVRNTVGDVVTFTYDAAQRIKTKILPDLRVITYNYDSNGNLTSITPPGKSEHKLSFGLNDLLATYEPPLISGVNNVSTHFSYNNDKQITKIVRPDGQELNFIYNQVTGLNTSIEGNFDTINMEYGKDLLFGIYQGANTLYQFFQGTVVNNSRYSMNGVEIYEYSRSPVSEAGEKVGNEVIHGQGVGSVSRSINYIYDTDEYLIKAGDLNIKYNFPNGQVVQTTLGSIKDYYYYNAFGELRKYVAKFKSDVIYEYELQRDALGRITKKTEILNSVTSVFDYVYDNSGRLIQVSTNGVVSSIYTYDSNSNRSGGNVRGENIVASYDEQDRLTSYNGVALTYNSNGELLTKGNENFTYDIFGNLREYTKGNTSLKYEVDPLQRRSGKKINNNILSRYVYNPEGKIVGQLDKNNKLVKTFVYATKSQIPDFYIDSNNNKFRIITDHLGSLRLVVSKSGRILQIMEHDEFGKVLQDTRPDFMPFGFAGGLYETRTKLVRFGARDYDSEIGRWLSKDPIDFEGGDTNLYGYVLQDPVNFLDEDGFEARCANPSGCTLPISSMPGSGAGPSYSIGIPTVAVGLGIAEMSQQKGERGRTRNEHGTSNPYKHYRPHPTDKSKVIYRDPHTGKTVVKPKPKDFDEVSCKK